MPRYVVLVKRKGSPRWEGMLKAKPGASRAAIAKSVRRNIRPGFVAKVVSSATVARMSKGGGGRASARMRGSRPRARRRLSGAARRRMLRNLAKARRARRRMRRR